MKISEQALQLIDVTLEDYYSWCDDNGKKGREQFKNVIRDFFTGVRKGMIYRDIETGKLITKYKREKEN